MYGDHILRTLMARSPKLAHTTVRRYSGSSSNSGGRPRTNSGGRLRRLTARVSSSGTLLPPFTLGQFVRPQYQGTPVVPFMLSQGPEQFPPAHHLSANHKGGVVIPVPSPPSPGGVYGAPPTGPFQGAFGAPPSAPHQDAYGTPPYQGLLFVQPPPPSISAPPSLPSSAYTNLIAVGTGDESRLWPSQDIALPGPQTLLSPIEGKAHVFVGATPPAHMNTPPASMATPPASMTTPTVPVTTAGLLSPVLTPPLLTPPLLTHKDVVCRHFMVGVCPFREKCWFRHPESSPQQTSVQAGDGSPLHGPVTPTNHSHSGPSPPIPSPNGPHGPVDPAFHCPPLDGLWPSPLVPGMYRGRPPVFPAGLSPGQPFLFLRPPLSGAHIPSGIHLFPSPNPSPDTALTFALLSEVAIRGTQGDVISEVSHLAVVADHFYLSFGRMVQAYKVLFGGTRSYQDSSVVQESCTFKHKVTCLHCSRPIPSLLVIGTEAGGVYTWDMKRGPRILTTLHEPEVCGVCCYGTFNRVMWTCVSCIQCLIASQTRRRLDAQ